MSHFITLVFVNEAESNLDELLEPYDEQTHDKKYLLFVDQTEEVLEKFESLNEEDKKKYTTVDQLADEYFMYDIVDGKYGYYQNPQAQWDWWSIGGRWADYIKKKDGTSCDYCKFDDIDWDKMSTPFAFIETDGSWKSRGEMLWWAQVKDEKKEDVWKKMMSDYVATVNSYSDEIKDNIMVYAIDMHI